MYLCFLKDLCVFHPTIGFGTRIEHSYYSLLQIGEMRINLLAASYICVCVCLCRLVKFTYPKWFPFKNGQQPFFVIDETCTFSVDSNVRQD